MSRRIGWLLASVCGPMLLLLVLHASPGWARLSIQPGDVIISEVAWAGTAASPHHEWIELYNETDAPIDLANWSLSDGGDINISLNGTIPAGGFFLLERTSDNTISDVEADQIYTGNLNDGGETLTLRDSLAQVIDTANSDGGPWPAGTGSPGRYTMERISPDAADDASGWVSNDGVTRNGLDANGNPINGTPKQPNSSWGASPPLPPPEPQTGLVLIDAVLYDGYELNDIDEAVRLVNLGPDNVDIGGWQLSKGTTSPVVLPAGTLLAPGEGIWLTRNAAAFQRQFGFLPDFEAEASVPSVAKLSGSWPQLPNTGGAVILLDTLDDVVDVLVYKGGNTSQTGWSGPAVQPYRVTSVFGEEGQILYRMRDQVTGRPVTDTNTAADWAQSMADVVNGRKVQYPGWRLDDFFFTVQLTETAVLTVAIAPDNAFEAIAGQIRSAGHRLQIQAFTFESIAIAEALIEAAGRGVEVIVFLEGGPVGGMSDQQRYICQQLEATGPHAQCWFMINDSSRRISNRYRFLHAKLMLVDGERVAVSSENLSPNSLPDDDKSDGTWGRRGVVLITDAPGVVAHVQSVFDTDFDPDVYQDLLRWTENHPLYGNAYGAPPSGFVPTTETGGITYTVRYSTAVAFHDTFAFEIVQAPENSLRSQDGLLGLVGRVGAGDTLLVQQLNERPYWGSSSSNANDDPNPRLEAYLAAARRGAQVRLLLDAFFDNRNSPTSNHATCTAVNTIAQSERLDLRCALANPTGLGIHNKMVLAQIDGRGYVHVGSINGTEQSSKGNRELALQVQSDASYVLLADMFVRDWPHQVFMPLAFNNYIGPADHILISEILYDPPGPDDAEFIELVNPTNSPIDMSGYSIGDAVHPTDFEDMRIFPEGTILGPHKTLVIATTATAFHVLFGFNPDFEILDTDPAVPTLPKDPNWGHPNAFLQLGNQGDEVLLRDAAGQVIDVVTYGTGHYPGVVGCALVAGPNRSLERYPYWRKTGNCTVDFREWPFPNPGSLPQ